MTSSVPPSVPNHIIGNNYNGSLMSLIPFQSSLCGIKKKKKRHRSHDFLFPPTFLQPGLSFLLLHLCRKLNKNQPVLMRSTVLDRDPEGWRPEHADSVGLLSHLVVSSARYTLAAKRRSPFSSSIPSCCYWGLTQPTPLANLSTEREASALVLTSLYLPHLIGFWILLTLNSKNGPSTCPLLPIPFSVPSSALIISREISATASQPVGLLLPSPRISPELPKTQTWLCDITRSELLVVSQCP